MAIIKCPECGHQISEKAAICPICGVEIAGKIAKCSVCGEVFFKDDGLCPRCYSPFKEYKESEVDNDTVGNDTMYPEETDETDETGVEEEDLAFTASPTEELEEKKEDETTDDAEKTEEYVAPVETRRPEITEDANDNDESSEMVEQIEDDFTYVDTDGDNLQRPEHVEDESDNDGGNGKHRYIPFVVSIAITALIAAVCLYFYNDSKISKETQAFELAINSGDISQMDSFLRNYTYATIDHKKAVQEKIADITKQKEDLSLGMVTRDKDKLTQYLKDYPESPQKQVIMRTIDSLDWEDAMKTNTKNAYDKYIAAHADGIFIKDAKERIAVKTSIGTEEDASMAKTIFREFFLSVNGNQAERLTATLNSTISSFAGTADASRNDVIGWMRNQHKEDVSNVIWKLNHDYKITKRELFEKKDYLVEFTAQKTIVYKDGRSATEHFKVKSNVSNNNKIASMDLTKYTPQKNNAIVAQSKPSSSSQSSNTTSTKKETSQAKPTSSTSTSKSTTSAPKSTTSTAAKTSTSAPKTNISSPKTNNSAPKTNNSAPKTNNSAPKTNNSAPKTNNSAPKATASTSKTGTSQSSSSSKATNTPNNTQTKKTEQKTSQGVQTAQSSKTASSSKTITASKTTSSNK